MIFDDNNNLHDVDSNAQTDGVKGEEVGFGDDASPPIRSGDDAKGVSGDAEIGEGVLQESPQLNQGSSACWERFLHIRSIKVLLVENDDSTRHVVTALLRNCNYEVMQAVNGLHAWKVLEDLTNHIDLVLSEVVMPCLSGVGLLCKIMSHKTRKNIPVIMMSSHNSMGLVFKCLSKGAVDFLVKPIRKNELRNLWQHVWRRCHSSSGSGSESGTQAQNSGQSKSSDRSDGKSGSDDADEDGSMGMMKVGNDSESESGTQNSWTKQAVDFQISHAVPKLNQVEEHPNNTCAQEIRPTPIVSATLNCPEQREQLENTAERLEMANSGIRTIADQQFNCLVETPLKHSGRKSTGLSEMNTNTISKKVEKGEKILNGDKVDSNSKSLPIPIVQSQDMDSTENKESVEGNNTREVKCYQIGPLYNHVLKDTNCGPSNVKDEHIEDNVGCASGSNHGSNGQNCYNTVANAGETNAIGTDHNRAIHREAILDRFRQKRKERCFKNKVQYHRRKRLEEQPDVWGQFGRKSDTDNSSS